ncbi:MAG TPA: nucleoside-diphosphate sugar epimerase/dehydratase [Thermoanaerobaculia bacterium]|nr:nucleoside-diphosphate sugar epimerase/dehydratase [Thermoanaerobaculia bacterium]
MSSLSSGEARSANDLDGLLPPEDSSDSVMADVPAADRPFWLRFLQRRTQLLLDFVVLVGALVLAYMFRFDFAMPKRWLDALLLQAPLVVLLQFAALIASGVYSFVWRYVGLREVGTFLRAAAMWFVPLLLLRLWLPVRWDEWRIPLSVLFMDTILAAGGLLALRVSRRMVYERYERSQRAGGDGGRRKRTLLVGAGRAGVLALREIQSRADADIHVVGFIDDDPLKQSTTIHGTKVLGSSRDLPRLARELAVDQAVITIVEAAPEARRRVVEVCERIGLPVRSVPGFYEILQGHVSISRFRDIAMEDLLQRDPVRLDTRQLDRFLGGHCVLVTGAGGSIGSELAHQVARFAPRRLVLLERAEFALFEVERKLRQLWPQLDVLPVIGDVVDERRIRAVLHDTKPDVVLHAAAHKHVPLMESNVAEAVRNNVFGTETVARVAGELGVGTFLLISTDKAVRPTSVMGASKRLAELTIQRFEAEFPGTRYEAVRFGNVLGSTGSVIPIFRDQIAAGGPVTVTDPDMKRYFMTIPEAAQLVLQAGAMGQGGEIFVLDMGEPVRIVDMAREMIRMSGYEDRDIKIQFTGRRPGEKLFEELSMAGEDMEKTRHPKVFIGRIEGIPAEEVRRGLEALAALVESGDEASLRHCLSRLVPEATLDGTAAELPLAAVGH